MGTDTDVDIDIDPECEPLPRQTSYAPWSPGTGLMVHMPCWDCIRMWRTAQNVWFSWSLR